VLKLKELFKRQLAALGAIRQFSTSAHLDFGKLQKALADADLPIESQMEHGFREILLWFATSAPADIAEPLAWRIACTYDWLLAGQRAASKVTHGYHCLPLQLVNVGYERHSRKGSPLMGTRFRILGGPFGGLYFRQLIPNWWLTRKLGKDIGTFGYTTPDARELGGFVFIGKKTRFSPDPKECQIEEIENVSCGKVHNSTLIWARKRPCPMECLHPCYACPIGVDNLCCREVLVKSGKAVVPIRPVHQLTFGTIKCRYCGEVALADPECEARICRGCQENALKLG
jgi:hypothetical protein